MPRSPWKAGFPDCGLALPGGELPLSPHCAVHTPYCAKRPYSILEHASPPPRLLSLRLDSPQIQVCPGVRAFGSVPPPVPICFSEGASAPYPPKSRFVPVSEPSARLPRQPLFCSSEGFSAPNPPKSRFVPVSEPTARLPRQPQFLFQRSSLSSVSSTA